MLCKEIIPAYSENNIKLTSRLKNADLLIIKVGGTYSYQWASND
jgi:hypothetical protein